MGAAGARPRFIRRAAASLTAALWLICAAPTFAQFTVLSPIPGTARDLAVDTIRQRLYLAQYDDGSVMRFDIASETLVDAIPTGAGAASLALSADRQVLACVNRLDGTVALIDLDSGEVFATTPVGEMPADIAALPGGGFAVANAFSDSVSIIDQRTGAVTADLTDVGAVPSTIAASPSRLAIGLRVPKTILLRSPGTLETQHVVQLDSPAMAVHAMPNGHFVVGTRDHVLVIDGETGATLARAAFPASQIAVSDQTIYAANEEVLAEFDPALRELRRVPLPSPSALAAAGGAVFAAADDSLQVMGEFATGAPAPAAAEAPGLSSETIAAQQPTDVLDEEVVEDTTPGEMVQEIEEERVEPAPADLDVAEAPPAPDPGSEAPPADFERGRDELEEGPASEMFVARPGRPQYRALRLGYVSRRPHAPYLGLGAAQKFREDLDRALDFEGQYAGLVGLNWQRNPEPERFDSWIRRGVVDTFEGDVEFHVDDAVVQTESMIRDADTGDVRMSGDVNVVRDTDRFRADYLEIRAPENLTEREILAGIPIVPHGYRPPRRYAYAGFVDAGNVEWHEPYRDLTATTLEMKLDTQDVEAERVHGRAGGLFFDADELTIAGPDSIVAEHAWITTCEHDPPHYTINSKHATLTDGVIRARNARLEIWGVPTPLVIPRLRFDPERENRRYRPDLELGSASDIGQYVNLGQWFSVSPYLDIGIRTMPTTRDGFGYGLDAEYDFRNDPRTPLFRSEGSLRSLYTTNNRGYIDFRHRQDLTLKTRFVGQAQQWSDRDFLSDWFYDDFQDQNGPRTFANFTHTRPGQIVTLTASPATHNFLHYSEKLPEASYHLLDRQIAKNLYLSWDSFAGYYELEPAAITTERAVNIARLSYDIQLGHALNILPFVEADHAFYEDRLIDEDSEQRLGVTTGVTLQSRLQRTVGGIGPYDRFKHIVVPSVSYLYRPDPSGDASRIPQLDGLDFRPGRERVEGKIENVILARHRETGDIWQLAHLALYGGSDFESEIGASDDVELEFSFRPLLKWGLYASAEHHDAEAGGGLPGGEYNRALGYIFYDNVYGSNTFNARLGYSYSDLDRPLDQRELLYGAGLRLGKKWSIGFEHRLELENNEITRETYEIRRLLHDWEVAIRIRDREEGFDASISITLIDFPTASLHF